MNGTTPPLPLYAFMAYAGAMYLCNVIQLVSQVVRYRLLVSAVCVNAKKFRRDNQEPLQLSR